MNGRIAKPAMIVALLLLGGCSTQLPLQGENATVALVPVTFGEWQKRLTGYKGEIVIVDMWATWCAPCVERFPHMVKLYEKYKPRGVRFVSLDLDDRSDPQAIERAKEFLVKQNAVFENYRMDEIVPDAFEKLDLLGIPAVLIYDRAGKLRYRLTGDNPNKQFTNEDVEKAIQDLLAASS